MFRKLEVDQVIYFMQATDGGPVKIGTSLRLSSRLRQVSREVGKPLKVLGVSTGERRRERELHQRFEHLRIEGEWFEPSAELRRFISRSSRPWNGLDELPAVAVTIKGDERWKAWLEEAASHCRMSVSSLVDVAVTQYVKAQGFEKKPPER